MLFRNISTFIIMWLISFSTTTAKPTAEFMADLQVVDVNGVSHKIFNYIQSGKSVILNFSSTWCKPCWNYQNSGVLQQVWDDHGPQGSNNTIIIMIEADENTCTDCLYGQEKCNDFTYGNWTTPFPISDINASSQSIVDQFEITKYPSIFAISAKDYSVNEVGQLSVNEWDTWIDENEPAKESSPFALTKIISKIPTLDDSEVKLRRQRIPTMAELKEFENKTVFSLALEQTLNLSNLKPIHRIEMPEPQSIELSPRDIQWNVFPNPCVDQLNIASDQYVLFPIEITIQDREGTVIDRRTYEGKRKDLQVDMTSIPTGSYVLKLKSGASTMSRRIIHFQ